MKLQDVFTQLSSGEFSQLSIGGQDAGVINENNFKQVIAHINLGLTALYRRFTLKEGRLSLQLQPGKYSYWLASQFAVSATRSKEPVRYILDDTTNPFRDDIHKIEQVYNGSQELGLNDRANPESCMTPSMATLVVPASLVDSLAGAPKLTVVYRANHPIISDALTLFNLDKVAIELPYSHLEALVYFVASRVNNPIGMTNEFHAGNNYAAKYEAACRELEAVNMRVDQGSQVNRLAQKGFV